jgi:hypothetical protein
MKRLIAMTTEKTFAAASDRAAVPNNPAPATAAPSASEQEVMAARVAMLQRFLERVLSDGPPHA